MPIAAGGTPRGFKGRGAGFELGACGFRLFFFLPEPGAGSRELRVAPRVASCCGFGGWSWELLVVEVTRGFWFMGRMVLCESSRAIVGHRGCCHTHARHTSRTHELLSLPLPLVLVHSQPCSHCSVLSHEPPRAGEPPVPRLPVPNCSPLSLIIRSQSLCRALGLSPPAHQASDNQQGLKQETGGFGLRARARARGSRAKDLFWVLDPSPSPF
jgi:hypothetical protein